MADNGGGGVRVPPSSSAPPPPLTTNDETPSTNTSSGSLAQQRLSSIAGLKRKSTNSPLALYSSSTWAFGGDSQTSTALPQNTSRSSLQPPPAASHVFAHSPLRGEYIASPPHAGTHMNHSTHHNSSVAEANSSMSGIRYTQTESYHTSSAMQNTLSQQSSTSRRNDPTAQAPLAWPDYRTGNSLSGSAPLHFQAVPGTPSSMAAAFNPQSAAHQPPSDVQTSPGSSVAISEHYSKTHPEQTGKKADVWSERPHPRGLRRTLKDEVEWVEAWPGAMRILGALNPEQYQMPYGTRVINIKSDFPGNILKSIRQGKISAMQKIAERIMAVWDARQAPTEKVLFIFAVNGSGRFTGVAEMTGPWDPKGSFDGWQTTYNSDPPVGTIPVVWTFVKDVAFYQFKHLRQDNGNPVGNMWNGMNFPSDLGRKVMETYVQTPATSSILGHPQQEEENAPVVPYNATTMGSLNWRRGGPSIRSARGGRGGGRGGQPNFRGSAAYQSQHWRAPSNPFSTGSDHEPTPTPTTANPTKMITLQSGQQVPAGSKFEMNERGQLVLCSPDIVKQEPGMSVIVDNSRAVHGARSLTSLRPSSASSSALQSRTTDSTTATSPHQAARFDQSAGSYNPSGLALQQYALQSPEQYYHSYGAMPYSAQQTPTHRPVAHGSRAMDTHHDQPQGLPTAAMSINMLQAKFHGITSELFMAQHELGNANANDANLPFLKAKFHRILVEQRQIEMQLAAMGTNGMSNTVALDSSRHDSFSSTDGGATSSTSNYNISPVRAEDGRVLKSASKYGSPPRQAETGEFDRAPGGSVRQKKGHAYKESYGDEVKKSINDLLDSPQDTPISLPVRPAHETSSFFQPNSGTPSAGKSFGFPASAGHTGMSTSFANSQALYNNDTALFQQNGSPNIPSGGSFPTPTASSFFTPTAGSFPTPMSSRFPAGSHGGGFPSPTASSFQTPTGNSYSAPINGSFSAPNGASYPAQPGTVQRVRGTGGGVRLDS